MIDVNANFIARPYRGVSVQDVPSLEPAALRTYLLGRRVYRRTEFLVAVHDDRRVLVQVERGGDDDEILVPLVELRILAREHEITFVQDETVDTGSAGQMARAALASRGTTRVFVVQGMFQHVNFIVEPAPVRIRVVEVVPPEPPKLLEMARAMLDVDEDLPPIDLLLQTIDLRDLLTANAADRWLLPCRSGGLDPALPIDFLDSGPAELGAWTLVGCERSRQIHVAMYGAEPDERIDFCPRLRIDPDVEGLTLMKCCIQERGIRRRGSQLIVPWGASLDEVRSALRMLVGLPPTATPVVVAA